nr:pirin family protein [uncultured Methanoregula sp.]
MSQSRAVAQTFSALETLEGAGVRLRRVFGYSQVPLFDPFLMLDDFRAERPGDYINGFPWHPHRGIETVTYMLEGRVEHGDSMGHKGDVNAGGIQWMTAGSGIIHQEMPKPVNGRMGGFQLWVNLPKSHKMMAPRYQEISAEKIPVVAVKENVSVRVICGTIAGISGPVRNIVADPEYLDISLGPGVEFTYPVRPGYMAAAYVTGGSGKFDAAGTDELENRTIALFESRGTSVMITAGRRGVKFLYFSGKPIREPVAWGGPIVMNTEAELQQAFDEYQNGTFIRKNGEVS